MVLKAIETRYRGYRFRSRLEARWAVFFDALGVKWQYEPEGFDLDGTWYLPDFWLETVHMWAEVKPTAFDAEARERCKALVERSGFPCLMLDGVPTMRAYAGYESDSDHGVIEMDWLLGYYKLDEDRFFGNTGCGRRCAWQTEECSECRWFFKGEGDAYIAARGARFEHGEQPR